MRDVIRPFLAAAFVAGLAAGPAAAQQYPILMMDGESYTIDYGPMARANVVGGGRVLLARPPEGMDRSSAVIHLEAMFSQQPRPGFVPLSVGDGEGMTVIYVPAMMAEQMRRMMQQMRTRG